MLTLCPKCLTTHTKNITFFIIASEVLKDCQKIFRHFQQHSDLEHFGNRKSSEVTGTFLEIPVITRQKSHVFDSEKVSRYTMLPFLATFSGKFTPMCARLASPVSFCNTAL